MGLRFPPKSRRRAKSGRKRGAQPGHKGTTWKLVPIEQVKESYDIKPDVCSHWVCVGGQRCRAVSSPGDRNLAMVAEVTEYRLHTLTCSECGAETRAQLPTGVPQGDFGPRLQPMVSLLSGRYHLSKRDTVDIFFHANVSLGSVPALKQRTSEVIRVPVDEAREYVKRQPVVHMDETGWREANQKAWLWVAVTTLVTVLIIRQSRGGKVAREILGEAFKGIVVSDRWSAYNWLLTILRQLCWNHLLRDFQTFVDRGGESQAIGEAIPAQAASMFQWWHKVRDGTMSRAIFQKKMQAVQRKVGKLLRQGTACNHSETAGTRRDILKREAALWTFARIEGVEPTNNLGERQVRPGVLWRKNSFGTQSEAGSRFAERIITIVATLKQQHRNVLDYLTEACNAANWGKQVPSLLPGDAVIAG